jgi:hypothetical protein
MALRGHHAVDEASVNATAVSGAEAPRMRGAAVAVSPWPIEDGRFARRVHRLRNTSAVALGLIWLLAERSMHAPIVVRVSLIAGWVLMPLLLTLSPRWPSLRFALALPSGLVFAGLIAVCGLSAGDGLLRLGWPLVTSGIGLGGVMGMWFWFGWLPIPQRLVDPFSTGRMTLISIHIALITMGLGLVAFA